MIYTLIKKGDLKCKIYLELEKWNVKSYFKPVNCKRILNMGQL